MAVQPIIERENYSGQVIWTGKLIEWLKPDGSSVSIDLENVVVIGEYTTDNGPIIDDWFLVFVQRNSEWEEISVYAEGFQELAQYLSKIYSIDFSKTFLANSTEWKSYIRYPNKLEGEELFVLQPPKGYKPATTIFQKLKLGLGIGVYAKAWDVDLTEEVKVEIANASG